MMKDVYEDWRAVEEYKRDLFEAQCEQLGLDPKNYDESMEIMEEMGIY